jgi:tRNA(adenine34) deaminase
MTLKKSKTLWILGRSMLKLPLNVDNLINNKARHDEFWMEKALNLARKAALRDEVPVGAVIVKNDQILAVGSNRRELWQSPTGHAELIAIQRASRKLKSWRLNDCTLFVTLEPCTMCAGALVQARFSRVVFGAYDAKGGALKSLYELGNDSRLNHKFETVGGILEADCAKLLKDFFKTKRSQKK